MTVYVESNFVLELALGQEQANAAEAILVQAERRQIELALPSFSLSEPFSTVTHRSRRRSAVAVNVNEQLRDLRRSSVHRQDIATLEPVVGVLRQVNQRETNRLNVIVDRVLTIATVIQVDHLMFRRSIQFQSDYDLSAQDAIIYAAALRHLADNPSAGPHFFISRNPADFGHAEITAELGQHGCIFVPSFNEGIQRLDQPLES